MMVSPVMTAKVSSRDKGSFGNRVNHAGSQFMNAAVTGGLAAGTIAGGIYLNNHTDKVTKLMNNTYVKKAGNAFTNILNKVKSSKAFQYVNDKEKHLVGKFKNTKVFSKMSGWGTKIADICKKAFNSVKSMPKTGKFALLGALALILTRGIYKSGQIEQKYTGRAKMEQNFI